MLSQQAALLQLLPQLPTAERSPSTGLCSDPYVSTLHMCAVLGHLLVFLGSHAPHPAGVCQLLLDG